MCSKEEKQFLLLFQFVINSGADVVRDYIDENITKSHGSFVHFLALKKHFFHHQVNGKLFCCKCPLSGCNIKKNGKMKRELFQMLYSENRDSFNSSHNVYRNRVKETVCICGYIENSVDISVFDISSVHWLISDLAISPNDKKMIENIIDVRNLVCHAINTKVFNATDLQRLWNQVEQSLIVINCSPRFIKRTIDDAKKKILCVEDVEKLTIAVQKFMEDGKNMCLNNNNNSAIDGIRKLQDSACSITKQNEESGIKLDKVAKDVHEIKELLQFQMNKKTVSVGIQCDYEVAARENGNSNISTPESTNPDAQMTLKGLEHSEEMTLIENSNNQEKEAGYENQPPVDILKGRIGSVVLDLKIRSDVFDSPVKLRTELIVAIKKVLQLGKIDTNVEGTITINVLFLNSLTEAQKEIIQRMLVEYTVEDSAASVITTTSTDILSQEAGEPLPTVNISTCSSCVEKDKRVGLLENQLLQHNRAYQLFEEKFNKLMIESICEIMDLSRKYMNDFQKSLEEIMDLSLKYRYEIERTKDEFKSSLMKRTPEFESSLTKHLSEFESSLTKHLSEFESSLTKHLSEFESSLMKRTSEFESSLMKRTSEFGISLMKRTTVTSDTTESIKTTEKEEPSHKT